MLASMAICACIYISVSTFITKHLVKVGFTCKTVIQPSSGFYDKRATFMHKDRVLKSDKICKAAKYQNIYTKQKTDLEKS